MSSINHKEHSGAEWLIRNGSANPTIAKISPLGIRVADFLGYLYAGIYHISAEALHKRVDWSSTYMIEVTVQDAGMATFDFDQLTKLVFLAHHFCLRVSIHAAAPKYIRLRFHQRKRDGNFFERHPTLAMAVDQFRQNFDDLQVVVDYDPWKVFLQKRLEADKEVL